MKNNIKTAYAKEKNIYGINLYQVNKIWKKT